MSNIRYYSSHENKIKEKRHLMRLHKTLFSCAAIVLYSIACLCCSQTAWANPDKAVFISPIVYRGDGTGDYLFSAIGSLDGTSIAKDGSVQYIEAPGIYKLNEPYAAAGELTAITLTWSFTGRVTMQVSATGNEKDYVRVINGVPLEIGSFKPGKKLQWKAILSQDSVLTEVRIVYHDSSGIAGGWGAPELSGFMFRKPIFIKGSPSDEFFNYQIPIKIGESSKVKDADFSLNGVIQADFIDMRFTDSDKETLLSYWREDIIGKSPNREVIFWVKIPEIPKEGHIIYAYYGNVEAEDLSDGESVFEFFDDFKGDKLDAAKWANALDTQLSSIEVSDSLLHLQGAKVTTLAYKFTNGIIEYKAKSTGAAIAGVVRGASYGENDQIVYSSVDSGIEHAIAIGSSAVVNTAKAPNLSLNHNYRVTANGNKLIYERFNSDWTEQEAEASYEVSDGLLSGNTGIYAADKAQGRVSYDWFRARKSELLSPLIDIAKTKPSYEEAPNLSKFQNITLNAKADIILKENNTKGEYVSKLIHPSFKTQIIIPSWQANDISHGKNSIAVDISAEEYGIFTKDCLNKQYYYASKKDFSAGDNLRWRARFNKEYTASSPSMSRFSLDFREGSVTVILPNGKETLKASAPYRVVWDAGQYEDTYKLKLEYSIDGGRKYKLITDGAENTSNYLWNTPAGLTQKALIKVSDTLDTKIYDTSNDYFSISDKVKEDTNDEEDSLSKEKDREPVISPEGDIDLNKLLERGDTSELAAYDLLVKIGDNYPSDPEEGSSGAYKEGDIVLVRPTGHIWSETEKASFLILQVNITEEESRQLTMPKLIDTGKLDENGSPIMKQEKTRAKKIDLQKLGLSKDSKAKTKDEQIHNIKEQLEGKALDKDALIEEKELGD